MKCDWIGDYFDGYGIDFPESGRAWKVGQKISEKLIEDPSGIDPVEAQAVYHAHQEEGPSVGQEAIIKIRMQVPPEEGVPFTQKELRAQAVQWPASVTIREIKCLERLTERGCTATPKLYAYCHMIQHDDMPMPGAYAVILVMEKLPGKSLDARFWDYPREKRDGIRDAFRIAFTELRKHNVVSYDQRPPNILYDESSDKCYIIDFELAGVVDDAKEWKWDNEEWGSWGLVTMYHGDDVY